MQINICIKINSEINQPLWFMFIKVFVRILTSITRC